MNVQDFLPTRTLVNPVPNQAPNQNITELIHENLELIELAQTEAEIARLLARRGYDAEALAAGMELCHAAQAALTASQAAIYTQQQAEAEYERQYAAARQAFLDYRAASLPLVKGGVRRYELALDGKVPEKPLQFIAMASSGYKVAFNWAAYLAVLKQSEVGLIRLETGCASLEALIAADEANETAKAVAIDAMIEYDEAAARLRDWCRRFRRTVRSVLNASRSIT